MVDCCLRLNQALQGLLAKAYGSIYLDHKQPAFHVPTAFNLPYELLTPLFDAELLDDSAYSRILEASIGFPLGENARVARKARKESSKPDQQA
jgi:hypothetical protein